MQEYALPEAIRGDWVWSRDSLDSLESYVFFRKEFMLSEVPASAELWITARTLFQVYVNGRYLGFGPPASPTKDTYVVYFDVGFLMETGKNTIAVLAHNTKVSRYSCRRHPSGLWAQLNTDGKPTAWTDRSWTCWDADCFAGHRPRSSVSSGFTEKVDFRYYPYGWQEKDFNSVRWKRPDHLLPVDVAHGELVSLNTPEWNVSVVGAEKVASRGTWTPVQATTHVSFAELAAANGAGVYVAETYLHSATEGPAEFELYSDDPYAFFVNGECVKQQGVKPLPMKADLGALHPPCFRQGDMEHPAGEMELRDGWNHLVITQHVEVESAGFTLVFADLEPALLRLFRQENRENMLGWSLVGPIHTPLPLVTGNLDISALDKTIYVPSTKDATDESAYLMSCAFTRSDEREEPFEGLELRQGDYAVLDLGTPLFGCPELVLSGSDEDVIDVVCGELHIEGQLLPFFRGRRNVDTIVLGPREYRWLGCTPRGLRYVMVAVRRAASTVSIQSCGVCVREYRFDNTGSFDCSDPMLNQIWEVGRRTLRATMQGAFLDSPAKEQAQYIADAMIQSWAGYHTYGAFSFAAKGIEEFAKIQFETGEMPALSPSDIYLNMPDYALLWPVWLQRHYLYTGDTQFLDRMLPPLDRLLSYYEQLSESDTGLLRDLDLRYGAYCFLDHGDLDRRGIVTGLNAIYCRALLSASWLHDEHGSSDRASQFRSRAAAIARSIRDLTWDEERSLFADSWHGGEMSDFYSWQTNVLAIYGGIASSDDYDRIFDKLFTAEEPFEFFAAGETNNPFFKYFILESAFALERRNWALKMLRWYWGGMIARGARTWWELFDPESNEDEVPTHSFCHGYGASPNGFLCTELAGVRPAKPGFTAAYFNPLPGIVRWLKIQLPTAYGRIIVEWELQAEGQFEAVIDANYPLEIIPVLPPRLSEHATIHVSPDVTILAEPE